MMNLESLANELLLDLFEFFSTIHLFHAFHGLNSRFDSLLFIHFRAYRLDFRFISKKNFDFLCDQYLSQISGRIIALRLSNDDETPQQIDLFLPRYNLFDQFTHLKAFSLYHVYSEDTMRKIAFEWEHLPVLSHLSIIQCCLPCDEKDMLYFINSIWDLPKLRYCNLDIYVQDEQYIIAPTIISSSIGYVSIKGILFDLNELTLLFEHTPGLRYLEAHNNCITDDLDLPSNVSSLFTLNLSIVTTKENVLMNFLKSMINLRRLTIDLYGICVDGHQWEQTIRDNLPNLKVFQLKEQFPLIDQNQGDRKMDTLLKSFQSRFWLDERKWLIQCDWNLTDTYSFISLYTLPYSFDEFTVDNLLISKSTCPKDNKHELYRQVHRLHYNACSFDETLPTHIFFSYLRHLNVEFPIHDRFWSIIPRFDHLVTLKIFLSDADTTLSELQILLDRATRLHSLTIKSSSSSFVTSVILNMNALVRRLDLQGNEQWFDDEQCTVLINSSLFIQCEMLAIDVQNCQNVLDLVNNMINLRALKIRCGDDKWDYNLLLEEFDEFVNWLRRCLPSTCTITRDPFSLHDIHFWIR